MSDQTKPDHPVGGDAGRAWIDEFGLCPCGACVTARAVIESQAATIATLQRESVDMRLRYAGCVGLLAECCVYVPEDERESIERACLDWAAGTKWGVRRILNRIDLTPPRADEEPKA